MSRFEIKIIFCLLLLCVVSRAADLSPEDVFDLLSRRLDDVIHETRSIKSELAETVNKIESKIETYEENIANLATNADFEKRIESFVEKEIMKFKDIVMSFVNEKINKQNAVVHRTLSIEKQLFRDKTEQFDDKYSTLEANVDSRLNNAESRLSSAESADRQLNSRLYSVERNQITKNSNLDSRVSQLSSRVAAEEARKVAFSALLNTKKSYYGKSERIVFDNVMYSYGGGYSSSTGIFTAPKSGTYLFTLSVEVAYSGNSGYAHGVLMIDDLPIAAALSDGRNNGGNAAVHYLWTGDTAYVQTGNFEEKYYIFPYRTMFNGVLID